MVTLLAWAHFLNDGAANYLPGILPALLVALGLPLAYAGGIMAVLVIGQGLQPLTGALSDRLGGRALPLLGLAGTSLGAAWLSWAHGLRALIEALVLIGVANSLFHPPALAAARRASGGSAEKAIAVFSAGGEIGRGLWPLLASLVVAAWGLHALWLLPLVAAPTLPWLWRQVPALPRRTATSALRGLRAAWRPMTSLLAYSALRNVLLLAVTAFVPLLWQERGGSLVTGAALITTMLMVGIIGNFGAAYLAVRWGRQRLVFWATAIACALLAAYLFAGGIWLWLALAGLGIAAFGTLPLTVLMGQDLLPQNHALGSGLALGFANALGAIGVALLGLLAARWGAVGVLWAAEACGIAALAWARFLPRGAGTTSGPPEPCEVG
ncbi:MAG: MFS transporter [Terriglobales bacterium]